jgi:hypothetical protein
MLQMVFVSLALGLFVILVTAARVGYWSGLRARDDQMERSRATAWQTALLALAGLLIGFTFSMAETRFAGRKQLVLAEANSIGTAYLRTRMLPDPEGEELRALFRQYVDARLAFVKAGSDRERIDETLRVSSALEGRIWSEAVAVGRAQPQSLMISLLVQATNDMFDAGTAHVAAVESPLPPAVFAVLVIATAAAMAAVGFGCGLEKRTSPHGMIVLPVLLGIVILLVFDLANPRLGFMRVHDPVLVQLKHSM